MFTANGQRTEHCFPPLPPGKKPGCVLALLCLFKGISRYIFLPDHF